MQLASDLDTRIAAIWRSLLRQSPREVSRTTISVLARLRDHGPQRITALADAESVAQPTMTTLVNRLERDGHVSRAADPDDGRAALIALSDEGRKLLERFGEQRTQLLSGPIGGLDRDQRAALEAALPALDQLIQNLKEQQ
jgi:DNA-binding MarR family transcriptional regulator